MNSRIRSVFFLLLFAFIGVQACKKPQQIDEATPKDEPLAMAYSAEQYVEAYDNFFATKTFVDKGMGPFYFDDATSIAKIFASKQMLRDAKNTPLKFETYDARNMDRDINNFDRLDSNRDISAGDVVVVLPNTLKCESRNGLRYLVVGKVNGEGKRQNKWNTNQFQSLWSKATHYEKFSGPGLLASYQLCVVLRNKHFL